VIAPEALILLDTNIVLYLLRGKAAGQWIKQNYQLDTRMERPLVSMISVGETLAIAERQNYGPKKRVKLHSLLENLVVVEIKFPIAQEYARIQAILQGQGTPIGENDTWIAATAAATASSLLTSDHHFEKLPPGLINVEIIDPPGTSRPS
jgi:tRNA(fMet)-specific endonuclease VapC